MNDLLQDIYDLAFDLARIVKSKGLNNTILYDYAPLIVNNEIIVDNDDGDLHIDCSVNTHQVLRQLRQKLIDIFKQPTSE